MNETHLESLMALSFEGDRRAAEEFFKLFAAAVFCIPERYQAQELSDSPDYPNDFVNILGVKQGERAIVPVFSKLSYIEEWCGQTFTHKELSGKQLLDLMPEDWWISLNPGQDIEKEISPWEIELLKGGDENIPALIDEIFPPEKIETLALHSVNKNEYPELREVLIKHMPSKKEITELYLLKEEGENVEGEKVFTVLIGARANTNNQDKLDSTRDELLLLAQKAQIGGDRVKVMLGGAKEDGLVLGMFAQAEPIYSRPTAERLINKVLRKQ